MTITNKVSLKSVNGGNTPISDVPDTPTIGAVSDPGTDGYASVAFTPALTGGAVTTFTATSTPGSITGTSSSSPITVTGLTLNTAYTFKVKGTNSTATGPESSSSSSFTPTSHADVNAFASLLLATGSTAISGTSIRKGSSGSVYAAGYPNSTANGMALSKFNSTGTLQWTRTLTVSAASSTQILYIDVDSSENIYVIGYIGGYGGTSDRAFVAKYDSSGSLQWQRQLYHATYNSASTGGFVDSSGNSYGGFYQGGFFKYNSSGTIQYQKRFSSTNGVSGTYGGAVDSSGNVYSVCLNYNSGQSSLWPTVVKFNSSGTYQSAVSIVAPGSSGETIYSPQVMNSVYSDNILIVGFLSPNVSGYGGALISYSLTNGTMTWQRYLSKYVAGACFDTSGNAYAIGTGPTTGLANSATSSTLISKYNSSGVLQWQRTISFGSAGTSMGPGSYGGINVDGSYMYITGTVTLAGNSTAWSVKLPIDGSRTGSHTVGSYTMDYATASVAETAGGFTTTTPGGFTVTTATHTDAAGVGTDASATYVQSLKSGI